MQKKQPSTRWYAVQLFFFVLFYLIPNFFMAQNSADGGESQAQGVNLPTSPSVSAGEEYNLVNVSKHTGVPSIGIPIYTVTNRELNIPISLRYHASGVKVQDLASWVGMGWNLSAGGTISRQVVGIPDDVYEVYSNGSGGNLVSNAGYLYNSDFSEDLYDTPPSEYANELWYLERNARDVSPDIFNFNFAGYAGRFVFGADGQVNFFSDSDLKIEYTKTANHIDTYEALAPYLTIRGAITEFRVTTPDGTQYIFNQPEATVSYGRRELGVESTDCNPRLGDPANECIAPAYQPSGVEFIGNIAYTSWHLSQVISANGSDLASIDFEYENEFFVNHNITNQQDKLYLDGDCQPDLPPFLLQSLNIPDPSTQSLLSFHLKKRLTAIKWAYGNIDFIADQERLDLYDYPYTQAGWPKAKALSSIQIKNSQGETLKTFDFDYGYLAKTPITCNGAAAWVETHRERLKLEQLTEKGGTLEKPPYVFTYDQTPLPPRHSMEQDYWGFYNGSGATNLFSSVYVYPEDDPTYYRSIYSVYPRTSYVGQQHFIARNDRSPNEALMQAGALKQIKYPSGAHTELVYEAHRFRFNPNKFAHANTDFVGGGLRIKKIIQHNGMSGAENAIAIEKEYEYIDDNGLCSGKLVDPVSFAMIGHFSPSSALYVPSNDVEAYTTLIGKGVCSSGSRVIYAQVQVKQAGNGKVVCKYDTPGTYSEGILQDEVVAGEPIFQVSSIESGENQHWFEYGSKICADNPNYDWNRGQVTEEILYNQSGSVVQRTSFDYVIRRHRKFKAVKPYIRMVPPDLIGYSFTHYLAVGKYYHLSGLKSLSSKTVEHHFSNGVVSTTTDYSYSSEQIPPIEISMDNSDGKTHTTTFRYPSDHDITGFNSFAIESELREKNILMPLEVIKKVDGNVVGGTIKEYQKEAGMLLLKKVHEVFDDPSAPLLRQSYSYYLNGTHKGLVASMKTNFHTHSEEFSYYPSGPLKDLLQVKKYGNWKWEYDYYEDTRQIKHVYDIDGLRTDYSYDDLFRITGMGARNGQLIMTYNYEAAYNLYNNNGPNVITSFTNQDNITRHEYFDGAGRPLQSVAQEYSPNKRDVIYDAVKYDALGRAAHIYHPINTETEEEEGNVSGTYMPLSSYPTAGYDLIQYESSPLNRALGLSFYDFGTLGKSYLSGGGIKNIMTGGTYGPNELFRKDGIDENGNLSSMFTDKIGQVILVRRYEAGENIDTYNGYDDRGNLKEAMSPMSLTKGDEYSYSYTYDNQNRLIAKKLPNNISSSYTYFDHDQVKTSLENGQKLWYIYNDYLQNTHVLPKDPTLPQSQAYEQAYIRNSYDNTGGTITTGKVIQSMARNLHDLSQELVSSLEYDPLGRIKVIKSDTPFDAPEITNMTYDGPTDRIFGLLHQYKTVTSFELNQYDHAKRLKDQYFSAGGTLAHISANEYNYRDELIQKNLGNHPNGTALQSIDYQYNKRGWLTHINQVLPSLNDIPIANCDPTPTLDGDCNNAPQINLEELFEIRLTEEPVNINCYEECEYGNLPGIVYACDKIARFYVNFISRIYEIRIDGVVADLPNYPYDLQLDNGNYHFGNLSSDLRNWLLQNDYQTDGVTTILHTDGSCWMDLVIQKTDALDIEMIGGNNPSFTSFCVPANQGYVFSFPSDINTNFPGIPGTYSYPYDFFTENCKYTRKTSAPSPTIDYADFPVTVYRVELASGDIFIVTESELGQYAGAYTILQCQTFENPQHKIEINANGTTVPITLSQLLEVRKSETISFVHSDTCGAPAPPMCDYDERIDPSNTTGLIYYNANHPPYHYFNFSEYWDQGIIPGVPAYTILDNGGLHMAHTGEYEWDLGIPFTDPDAEVVSYKIVATVMRLPTTRASFIFGVHDGNNFLAFNGGQTQLSLDGNIALPYTLELVLDTPPTPEQLANIKTVLFSGGGMISELYAELSYRAACPPESCEPTAPPCSPEEIAFQLASIEDIKAAASTLIIQNLTLPTNLMRVILCDGTPVYLLEHELAILQGNYTIVQWIGITDLNQVFTSTLEGENTPDAFGMRLYYEETQGDQNEILDGAVQKNGNIANAFWQARGRQIQRYGYNYDELDRLTGAIYKDRLPGGTWANDNKYSVSNISYDKNGNILTLYRRGLTQPCPGAPVYGFVDALNYTQYHGNQVGKIIDGAPSYGGVRSANNGFSYDPQGNLGAHTGKNMTSAQYNYLNLPQVLEFASGSKKIEWIYDATGRKWGKIVKQDGDVISSKDYIGNIEYANGALEAVYHPEGRVIGSTFEYTIRDHLGNARVYFSDLNDDGEIQFYGMHKEVIQEQHYYPFGMPMEGNWASQVGTKNLYQYNGKELNEEFGLDWNDYGARFYDAAIGRWNHVDPLANSYTPFSPYNYVLNNPIINIDPDGRNVEHVQNEYVYDKEKDVYVQVGTKGGDEKDYIYEGVVTKQANGKYTVAYTTGDAKVVEVETEVDETSEVFGREPGKILIPGADPSAGVMDGADYPIFQIIPANAGFKALNGFTSVVSRYADDITSLGFAKLTPRVPKGEIWKNLVTGKWQKGGTFIRKKLNDIFGYFKVGGNRTPSTNVSLPRGLKTQIGNDIPEPIDPKSPGVKALDALGRGLNGQINDL